MGDELTAETRIRIFGEEIDRLNARLRKADEEIERLRSYTDACNTLLAERVEIECLRGLAVRAWHSFRSGGLTNADGMPRCLSDADIAELKRLADADAAKKLGRDVFRDCQQGNQRCHECPDVQCADNMSDATELTRLRAENADLRQQLIDAGAWEEEHPPT